MRLREAPLMSEAELQTAFIELAQLFGWRIAHFRPAMTSKGWRTPVEADGKGFPDVIAVRGTRCLAVEFKSARGRLSKDQVDWLDAFEQVHGVEQYVFRPDDWRAGACEAVLRGQ